MPHFKHALVLVEVVTGVLADVVIAVLAMSSRSGTGRCDTLVAGGGYDMHTARAIDPGDPLNIMFLLAFEWIQASPQSVCSNDVAS